MTALTQQLQQEMERRLSPKRADHSREVAREVLYFSEFFPLSPEEQEGLLQAALLHDITKEESTTAQLMLLHACGLSPSQDDLRSKATLHAFSGYACARKEFDLPEAYALAIRRHSTGGSVMTLLDKLLFCADYTEATRPYDNCQRLRRFLHQGLEGTANYQERLAILDQGVYNIANATLEHLLQRHLFIHPDTLALRNALTPPTKGRKK